MASLAIGGCADLCDNEIVETMASPNGELAVVVFTRNCGATTGYSTQVSILKAGTELPNEAGNVFIAQSEVNVAPKWLSANRLVLAGVSGSSGSIRGSSADGVVVEYEQKKP